MAEAEFLDGALGKDVDDEAVGEIVGALDVTVNGVNPPMVPSSGPGPRPTFQQPRTIAPVPMSKQGPVQTNCPPVQQQQQVQIVNVRPGAPQAAMSAQKNIATVSPRVVIGSPQIVATRPAGPGITLQSLQNLQSGQPGHLLLKTESGQFQLLRVGPPMGSGQGGVGVNVGVHPQPIRIATVGGPGVAIATSGVTVVPQPGQQTLAVPSLLALNSQPNTSQNGQQSRPTIVTTSATANPLTPKASIDNLKEKCRKFLSNLLDLSSKEPKSVERNVRILIQELIDSRVEPEAFCARLEKLLNAQPQPCLIGFLKKTLPILRQSLLNKELVIEGIHPPPSNLVFSNTQAPSSPTVVNQATAGASGQTASKLTPTPLRGITKTNFQNSNKTFIKLTPNQGQSGAKPTANKDKDRPKYSQSYDADKMGGDDDINDVAAMGGVNLAEESQKILGSTDTIGTQIRSCKDEYLAQMGPLQARLKQIAAKHGLDEPGFDVAALVSHAVQERLKNMVEKLSCIAEHRMDVIKLNSNYEVTQDVKGQLKFLEDLDRVERKKREDFEREILMRAAKSRSKSEDPEQVKLKEKAKEMQRAEMEEMRQREANLTALQAIGPRKKPRMGAGPNDGVSPVEAAAGPAEVALGSKNGVSRSTAPLRARMKRVNYRDMLFLLEQEKESARSVFLYKSYLK